MQDSLIINARRELCWHRRLASDLTTFGLWAAWLWLCRPLFGAVATMCGAHLGSRYTTFGYAINCTPATIEFSAIVLAGASVVLVLWNQVAARRALRPRLGSSQDYAAHFGLTAQDVQYGRDSSVCVVHHDECGRIVQIQARGPALSASC